MVLGRKSPIVERPSPPGVDEILEDLQNAKDSDPVYALSRELLGGLLVEGGDGQDLNDPDVFYRKVTEYIETADRLDLLSIKISAGTDSLVQSHQELKDLSKEIQGKLEDIRDTKRVARPTSSNQISENEEDSLC